MATEAEAFLIALSERLWPIANERFSALSASEQVFMLVWELEAEVNGGGFNQFFSNSAGDRAGAAAAALRAIGADRTAAIVDEATSMFPDGPPADRSAREEVLAELDPDVDLFESLDEAFSAYPDDLSGLLHSFVLANRSDIRSA